MDCKAFKSHQDFQLQVNSARLCLDIASSLVAPSAFLFSRKQKPTTLLPAQPRREASEVMDKRHQPSSFQQLEKVCRSFFYSLYCLYRN